MRRSLQIPGLRQGGRLTVSEGAPQRLIGSSSPARLFLVRGRLTATDGAREAGRHGAWERREQASPRGYAWFRGSCQSSCAVWEGGRLGDGDLMVLQNSLIRFHWTLFTADVTGHPWPLRRARHSRLPSWPFAGVRVWVGRERKRLRPHFPMGALSCFTVSHGPWSSSTFTFGVTAVAQRFGLFSHSVT